MCIRDSLLGLLDVGKRLFDVRIILQAVLEVKAVLQCDLLVESHAHVGVIGDFVVINLQKRSLFCYKIHKLCILCAAS